MSRFITGTQGAKALGVFFMLITVAMLTACATRPIVTDQQRSQAWKVHQQTLVGLEHWSFSARLAVKDKVEDSWSASLRWQQGGDSYDIRLSGAFGQGAVRLFGHTGYAVIETADHAALTATSAELLMEEQLGWSVPVRGLKYWLVGLPEPSLITRQRLDAFGRLSELEQSGWQVRYSNYQRVDGLELPRKLELENARLRARLVIDRWQLEEKAPDDAV